MIRTPLLPRPWLELLTSLGDAHSTCICASPNFSLLMMLPVLGTTSMYPFSTLHRGGRGLAEPPPSPCSSHCDRSLPSKRTTASEGGRPGCSGVLAVPGFTTGG